MDSGVYTTKAGPMMMAPTFILSYPRSRTAWLSMFLTGCGAFAFHEAWKWVNNVKDLRALMESKGPGPTVNADCANVLFLPEIRQEFPDAKFILVQHDPNKVLLSLYQSYGVHDYGPMMAAYDKAFAGVEPDMTVSCADWDIETSRKIWAVVSGHAPIDEDWLAQCEGMQVQLMPWQIAADIERARRGDFNHIVTKLRG